MRLVEADWDRTRTTMPNLWSLVKDPEAVGGDLLLAGVRTHRAGELLERILRLPVSAGQVSRLAERLDMAVRQFHTHRLADEYVYPGAPGLLDAIYLKARGAPRLLETGLRRPRKRVVLVADGVTRGGHQTDHRFPRSPERERTRLAELPVEPVPPRPGGPEPEADHDGRLWRTDRRGPGRLSLRRPAARRGGLVPQAAERGDESAAEGSGAGVERAAAGVQRSESARGGAGGAGPGEGLARTLSGRRGVRGAGSGRVVGGIRRARSASPDGAHDEPDRVPARRDSGKSAGGRTRLGRL